MKTPLVSIVINNYNYGRFLRDAIESAINQTYPNVEVIVVDDGSTDESREIIAQYAERGRVVPVLKENGGQASAFNAGFANAKGDIIIFLDADDVLLSKAAEEVASVWRPDLSKVQYRLEIIDGTGKRQGSFVPNTRMPSGDLSHLLLTYGAYPYPPTSGNAWSRRFLKSILPMPESEWRISADAYLIQLAGVMGEIVSLGKVLGLYRVHGENLYAWSQKELDPERLRFYLLHDIAKEELLRSHLGEVVPQNLSMRRPEYVRVLVALARLFPYAYPFRDSLWTLVFTGVKSSIRSPWLSPVKRLAHIAYFLGMGVLPKSWAKRLATWAIVPASRPAWLRRLSRHGVEFQA